MLPDAGYGDRAHAPGRRPAAPVCHHGALGWQMIHRVLASAVLLCDALSGRIQWLRHQLPTTALVYLTDVPADTPVAVQQVVGGADTRVRRCQVRATERGVLGDAFAAGVDPPL